MKTIQQFFMVLFAIFLTFTTIARPVSPVGYWQSVHPDYTKPIGIVKISKFYHELMGELILVTPINDSLLKVCHHCREFLKSKPLTGPIIMCNYRRKENTNIWINGKIVDSKTAQIFNSSLRLRENGNEMVVRARFGFLFKSAVWKRIDKNKIYQLKLKATNTIPTLGLFPITPPKHPEVNDHDVKHY